jgi:hypothetical protein
VIKKPLERGGHSPRWAAEPEKINNYNQFQKTVSFYPFFLLTPPMKMENTGCSEKSVYKIQTLGNRPKEIIDHSEHCESLK